MVRPRRLATVSLSGVLSPVSWRKTSWTLRGASRNPRVGRIAAIAGIPAVARIATVAGIAAVAGGRSIGHVALAEHLAVIVDAEDAVLAALVDAGDVIVLVAADVGDLRDAIVAALA